jgi:hypothetical protein
MLDAAPFVHEIVDLAFEKRTPTSKTVRMADLTASATSTSNRGLPASSMPHSPP